MAENSNEPTSKLLRLEMIFVFHTEEELVDEEDLTPIEELPRWTVSEVKGGFQIQEGIELLESALARRFSDPLRAYVKDEVAVELPTMPEKPTEEVFEG